MSTFLHGSWAYLVARILLVAMFPFSALDKAIHWNAAMAQCRSSFIPGAPWMLVVAMAVEIIAPACIVVQRWPARPRGLRSRRRRGLRPPLPAYMADLLGREERFTVLPNDQGAIERFIRERVDGTGALKSA